MILTYTGQRDLYGKLTNNETSANKTLGDTLISSDSARLVRKAGGKLLERTATDTTTASTQSYELPAKLKKLKKSTITVGTTVYPVKFSPSLDHWLSVNRIGSYTSDIPEWAYVRNRTILFFPTPATTSNTITHYYEIMQKEQAIADYTTGGILTATNGSKAIVGTGTSFTAAMAGMWIRITESSTANKGDGVWYEIASVTDTTNLTLVKKYEGVSIAAGNAAYTIGEVSVLSAAGYGTLPVYRAVEIYYSKIDQSRAAYFKSMADDLESEFLTEMGSGETTDVVLEDTDENPPNPNLYVRT